MQFVVEVAVLECSFLKHSQGILGVNIMKLLNATCELVKCSEIIKLVGHSSESIHLVTGVFDT
jgi:hypothetical protein